MRVGPGEGGVEGVLKLMPICGCRRGKGGGVEKIFNIKKRSMMGQAIYEAMMES